MKVIKAFPFVSLLASTVAFAEPELPDTTTGFDHAVPAARNALEIGVATGYAQGGGELGGTMGNLEDIAGPGAAVELALGYRLIPHLSLGAYGSFSTSQHGDSIDSNTDVLGATAGIEAIGHFRPDRAVDPWISLGTGWRGLWLNPASGKVTSLQGLDLARLQLGVDYRLSKNVAIAPVIGGSLSMFVSQDNAMTTDLTEIQDKKVNFTGFAGLSGRFDLGGSR